MISREDWLKVTNEIEESEAIDYLNRKVEYLEEMVENLSSRQDEQDSRVQKLDLYIKGLSNI